MNRRPANKNDETMCLICDLWWLWLSVFIVLIAAILTWQYWGGPIPIPPIPVPIVSHVSTNIPSVTQHQPATPAITPTTPPAPADPIAPTDSPTPPPPVGIGSPAPDFTLPQLGGGQIALNQHAGKPVVLVFFASFDSSSEAQAPTIRKLGQTHQNKIVILPISIYSDSPDSVKKFIGDYDWNFPIALDETGSIQALYEQNSIPAYIFINKDGKIVNIEGLMTSEQLEQKTADLTSP